MPGNVEIKAKVHDSPTLRQLAAELSGSKGELLEQEDYFFRSLNGRLKLRIQKDGPCKLIYYNRPDQKGPKFSEFYTTVTSDPENLKLVLEKSMGICGVMKKKRYLYVVGQTRIHVDEVDNLGSFMELEVQIKDGQSAEEGHQIATDLMQKLGVKECDLLTCAYMDLILGEKFE